MLHTINGEVNVICRAGSPPVVTTTPLALYLFFVDRTKTLRELEAELLKHHEGAVQDGLAAKLGGRAKRAGA